jgi:hypothetical protein
VATVDVAWSADFSYSYLNSILTTIKSNFDTCLLQDAARIVSTKPRRTAFLRQDIDVAPRFALPVARMEARLNLRASYQVMIDSPMYGIDDPACRQILAELLSLGHEVGLHVNLPDRIRDSPDSAAVLDHVRSGSEHLESIIGVPVPSISFHRPPLQVLRGPLLLAGRVNGYAEPLMDWYLSDSAGRWRQGPPVPSLLRPGKSILQLLTHPIWWGPTHMSGPARLQAFFEEETGGKGSEFAAAFDDRLSKTVGVWRSGYERPSMVGA